jgi:RimJ/RimL family protein N-acetyltransferase
MVDLRPVESEDVAGIARILAHPQLVGRRGLDRDRPVARSAAALTKNVESFVDPDDGDAWVLDVGGTVVGLATVGWWWDAHTPWANVVVAPEHQRRGHGTEAAEHVLGYLFGETLALLVEYSVPSWDADGLTFADSIGGERIGARRRAGVRHGRYFDTIEFALTRTRWEERHAAGR